MARTLEQWLTRQIISRECRAVEVRHLSGKAPAIYSEEIPEEIPDTDIGVLARELENECQNDAEGIGALQRYAIVAKRADGKEIGRFVLRARPEEDDYAGGFDDDGNTKALVSQQMRHTEAIMRVSVSSMGQILGNLFEALSRSQERERLYSDKHLEMLKLTEELMDRSHEREMEAKEQEFKQDLAFQAVDQIKPMLPVIAAKLMGKKADIGDMAIKSFLESLSPEQLAGLRDILTPEQSELVMSIIDTLQGKEQH